MFLTHPHKDMFDDVADEILGQTIKAKILEVFGFYPIIDLWEKWEIWEDDMEEPVILRDYHVLFDTEKLDQIGGWELNYVQRILERLIKSRMADPEKKYFSTTSSKKYSFSDTPEWWTVALVEEVPQGRRVIDLGVELG